MFCGRKVVEKWSKSGRKVVECIDNILNLVYNIVGDKNVQGRSKK